MCPACGTTTTAPLFTSGGYDYRACTVCGSARLDPIPEIDPAELYDDRYFVGGSVPGGYADYGTDESLHRRNAADRLQRIADAGYAPPGHLVEIGSGYGYFLDEALKRGWGVSGSDISAHARRQAGELGIDLTENPEQLVGPADVLTAFQVLEHMADPFPALRSGLDLVRPGGLVIVETWDRSHWMARRLGRRWQQVAPPSVIHLFAGNGLLRMAERLGLVDGEIRPTSKYVSLGAVAGQLATGRNRFRRPLERVRASRLGTSAIRYRFGDLITLTARRPD